MTENPYQPPPPESAVVDIPSGRRSDLVKVAQYQKGVIVCILVNILAYTAGFIAPPGLKFACALVLLAGGLAGAVFAVMLAIKVSNMFVGVLMGLLTLIPFVNLFALLSINQRATRTLTRNGIKVGFLGADIGAISKSRHGTPQ